MNFELRIKMKRVLVIALLVLVCGNSFAQKMKVEQEKVKVFLKNGETNSVYIESFGKKSVTYRLTPKGDKQEMDIAAFDSIVADDGLVIVSSKYIERAELPFKKHEDPTWLVRIFSGKNIDGYKQLAFSGSFTPMPGGGNMYSASNVSKYFFKIKGDDYAYSYYKFDPVFRDVDVRKGIALAVKNYPIFSNYMKSAECKEKTTGIHKDPKMILPIFDELLDK
jgi:hypothetical protein